jgi:hypothetical protein
VSVHILKTPFTAVAFLGVVLVSLRATAEELPRTPNLLPHCMIEAVVTVKKSDQPTTLTYKVTSCYWGNDALAVKITRHGFAFVGYEVPQTKTVKHWLRGWDKDFFISDGPLREDTGHIYHVAVKYAHLGALYDCLNYLRGRIEDDGSAHVGSDGTMRITYSAWEHTSAEDGTEIYKRLRSIELAEAADTTGSQSIPQRYDVFSTITLTNGHLREVALGRNTLAQYEGYGAFGNIPARAFIQSLDQYLDYKDIQYSISSVVTSVHPFGPHDRPDLVVGKLSKGIPRNSGFFHSPRTGWVSFASNLRRVFGYKARVLVIGLAFAVCAVAAIRKFRLV